MARQQHSFLKGQLIAVEATCLLAVAVVLCCNLTITNHAKGKIYNKVEDLPAGFESALLLGTSPISRYTGQENRFFRYRIDATETLYKSGHISRILVSGDEHSLHGLNEVTSMRDSLVGRGIPDSIIILDGKGLRTYDSVIHSQETFPNENVIIISQRFHNERAIYLADHLNTNNDSSTIAFNAYSPESAAALITYIREWFARVKVFRDLIYCHSYL